MSGPRLDRPQPQKEPLHFEPNVTGAPPELVWLIDNISEVAEKFLYHWKTFPIVLPPPVHILLQQTHSHNEETPYNTGGGETMGRKWHRPTFVKDMFITPNFNELDVVAVDSSGEPRRLTGKQLESLRERGELEVPSLNFPGQVHVWRISALLQKGREVCRTMLLDDLALALRFLLVTARARLHSHFFSVSHALHSLLRGTLNLLDLLLGVPSLQAQQLEEKLNEERCRYLVAELVCRPDLEEAQETLYAFVRKQLRRAVTEKYKIASQLSVPIPYIFLTPKQGCELDLRLFNKAVMRKAQPKLDTILLKETRGWFLHFRERLISELRAQKLSDDEIEREVNVAVMKEYTERVYNHIISDEDLKALGEGIPQLMVQQAQSVVLMHRAVQNVRYKLKRMKEELTQRLQYKHTILSRIEPWMRDKLRKAEERFTEDCQWSAHEEALLLCNNDNLQQAVYFLHRDLTFMKEREPVLKKELRKVKTPTREFHWHTQVWCPENWLVKRCFQGTSRIVTTVKSSTPTSITTPRSDPSQPVFLVEKEVVRTTTTRWALWRWINYCHRTWAWSWNAMFFFGVIIPWCSPLSLRALVSVRPFAADWELSQVNGTLFPRKSSLTKTLGFRLLSLWRHISKSRTDFETRPDTGFIGKGMTRLLNRGWNYGVKGLLGTLCLVVVFPAACLSVSILSLFIALTTFLWMPLVVLAFHISMMVIYDLDQPVPDRPQYLGILHALVWDVAILGLLQPVAALLVALVICPLTSFTIATVSVLRYWLRLLYDTLIFHLLIKKRARVPACDGFLIRRISGPGLSNDFFYQIRPEQALAAVEANLEMKYLDMFEQETTRKLMQPEIDFRQFVEACFGPFSAKLSVMGPYYVLKREVDDLITCLREKVDKRRRELSLGLPPATLHRVRMSHQELRIAIHLGAMIMEKMNSCGIVEGLEFTEDRFWDLYSLSPNDWPGMASEMYTDIFGFDFLTPLDDQDTRFQLEPLPNIDLSRYTQMVRAAELGSSSLDLLVPLYSPRRNIQVHAPHLSVGAFDPSKRYPVPTQPRRPGRPVERSTFVDIKRKMIKEDKKQKQFWSNWQPWKRPSRPYNAEKLLIPLPVPHPACIAVSIHNRDAGDFVPLESSLCQEILRAIEDCSKGCEGGVTRYRGGGVDSSFDSTDSRSYDSEDPPISTAPSLPTSSVPMAEFNWRQSEWVNPTRRRRDSGTVRVDLASPEDVSLDTDSTRVVFSNYGTTV